VTAVVAANRSLGASAEGTVGRVLASLREIYELTGREKTRQDKRACLPVCE
jgi:hypothetical protein